MKEEERRTKADTTYLTRFTQVEILHKCDWSFWFGVKFMTLWIGVSMNWQMADELECHYRE